MPNPYYTPSGIPATSATALSSAIRAEFGSIGVAFDKPSPFTPANSVVVVNSAGSAITLGDSTYESKAAVPTVTFQTPGDLSVVYQIQSAWYVKIGRMVSLAVNIQFIATYTTSSGTFAIVVTGVPRLAVTLAGGATSRAVNASFAVAITADEIACEGVFVEPFKLNFYEMDYGLGTRASIGTTQVPSSASPYSVVIALRYPALIGL